MLQGYERDSGHLLSFYSGHTLAKKANSLNKYRVHLIKILKQSGWKERSNPNLECSTVDYFDRYANLGATKMLVTIISPSKGKVTQPKTVCS